VLIRELLNLRPDDLVQVLAARDGPRVRFIAENPAVSGPALGEDSQYADLHIDFLGCWKKRGESSFPRSGRW
jgi:hypothetical protein